MAEGMAHGREKGRIPTNDANYIVSLKSLMLL